MFTRNAPVPGEGSTTAIVSWFLFVVSTFAVLTRLGAKWATIRRFDLDDSLAVTALCFDLGSSIAVHMQAMHGLGYPLNSLGSDDKVLFMKSLYALFLTYIPTLCFAKLSIIALLLSITPDETHYFIAYAIAVSITLGGVATELAAAFQCHVPRPWIISGNQCFERASFWRSVGVFSIACDLALIALPFFILVPIQLELKSKLLILISFSSRFLDIAAVSTQLRFTSAFNSQDISLSMWKWVFLARITQCISIVTSCVPYLRPLLESLPSGLFLSDEFRRRGLDTSSHIIESGDLSRGFGVSKTSAARASRRGIGIATTGNSDHDAMRKQESEVRIIGNSPSLVESQRATNEVEYCDTTSQDSRSNIVRDG